MAMKPQGFGSRQWRSLLQRGLDTASEFADVAAQKINAAADPRARLLRKRRWALRLGLFFAFACVFWALVTVLLATWSIPFWAIIIPGVIAAGAAAPATLLLLRYRWLRAEPLPAPRPGAARRLPPLGSAARGAIVALGAAERSMFNLIGIIERGQLLPRDEIRELTGAANSVAATMSATATDVVSMERAVAASPSSRPSLAPTIDAFAAQLNRGVQQYNEMVSAAAQLVSSANTGSMSSSPMSGQRYRDELVGATDRLLGWAQAFDELSRPGPLRRSG
jgi:hypothetical protein